ncbi:DUF3231 family protein [Paenibacillus gansuensis]|uniref:DUF3231 family protein n=1 Tax=Paenibacillus gansuensis TaxID=306542 RepID=A0ABW5PCU0_9BACL
MGILSGKPNQEPLHYGEIHGLWCYSMMKKALISSNQTMLNHAGDEDLRELLKDSLHEAKGEAVEVDDILKENGITPPPYLPEKPKADLESIPVGARFTDLEIAGALAAEASGGLIECSKIMAMVIREDIGVLFEKYHTKKAAYGTRVLRMLKDKGWLIHPPLQIVTGNTETK